MSERQEADISLECNAPDNAFLESQPVQIKVTISDRVDEETLRSYLTAREDRSGVDLKLVDLLHRL